MAKIKESVKRFINDYLYIPIIFNFIYFRDLNKIKKVYGNFEWLNVFDIKKYTLVFKGRTRNVVGELLGELIKIVSDLHIQPRRVLLDGDSKSIKNQIKNRFSFNSAEVLTVGIGKNFDYNWNFENDPPKNLPNDFDLIISQAMFEHLINPYKHLVDLAKSTRKGGVVLIHTVMPGFPYHRYPIDAVRFFPDWFETSADRLKLKIVRKFQRDFHLFYLLKKV
ncbi:MAG: Methyltransferase type 11 [Candidatus Woesebacteria bacterium GW2011_GWA1_39_11b]|nr:MAG: Methyltransferase type 11 [Candidatus Woesebacteria bacterium GW2011_GWA1_39_11b]